MPTRARHTPLPAISTLSDGERAALAGRHTVVDVPAQYQLCRQGRTGSELVFIIDGGAEVFRNGTRVAAVGPGDVVGEMSIRGDRVYQNADVVTTGPSRVAVVSRSEWGGAVKDNPQLGTTLRRIADERASAN
jgi:CRP/FNR family transcriptional regulator, cyclic AMP receptor protein